MRRSALTKSQSDRSDKKTPRFFLLLLFSLKDALFIEFFVCLVQLRAYQSNCFSFNLISFIFDGRAFTWQALQLLLET